MIVDNWPAGTSILLRARARYVLVILNLYMVLDITKYIGYAHIAGLYVCLHANVLRSIPRLVATCM